MNLLDIFLIALGLSADAFAVAIGLGLSVSNTSKLKNALIVGVYFGVFQAVMPLIGFIAAVQFSGAIDAFGHWVAFIVLVIIGGKMIWGSYRTDGNDSDKSGLKFSQMIPLAIATSIDALVVGASFAFLQIDILPAVGFIGITTFALSALGFKVGSMFGAKWQSKANLAGGIILVVLGIRVLFI